MGFKSSPKRINALFWLGAVLLAGTASLSTLCEPPPVYACCSLAPAKFAGTKGFAGESHKDGKLIHTLAYQNRVQNLSPGGNAMFLPIPAKPGSMNEKNIIDTRTFPHFLDHMEEAIRRPPPRSFAAPKMLSEGALSTPRPIVFDYDIYTIVLAQDANDIPQALARVPKEKRPTMNKEIFSAYSKWYPGWTFALCCFNNKDAKSAKPMFWWYEPSDPTTLFFPALDAHTGGVPKINEDVYVEHALMFSSEKLTEKTGGKGVQYRDFSGKGMPPALMTYLPMLVNGDLFKGKLPQGDFSVKVEELNKGNCLIERVLPPGLKKAPLGDSNKLLKPAEPTDAPMNLSTSSMLPIQPAGQTIGNISPYRKKMLLDLSTKLSPVNAVILVGIAKDGSVGKVEIAESSGNKKGDKKAIDTIKKMHFDPLPEWYKGASLDFKFDLSKLLGLKPKL